MAVRFRPGAFQEEEVIDHTSFGVLIVFVLVWLLLGKS